MDLTFWYHPFSSFCRKALIALYESGIAFDKIEVDLGNATSRADFLAVWPVGKFPVMRDETSGELLPESSIIIEWVADKFPHLGLIPADTRAARHCRMLDRFFDFEIHLPMQRIVADYLRPEDKRDPFGQAQDRAKLRKGYGIAEDLLGDGPWAAGDAFTIADCSAQPALHFASLVEPLDGHPKLAAYLERLYARPSVAQTMDEARPFEPYFPVK
ncbi:glutathione S-transferase family protein [Sphingomonas montanisoli]|uniref:Glutathione S-transferase family protein n=1 Tax=Sphingomonas montanisoli TaxID=2606412 RepID=A0A5D9C8Q3_9SPHN|nr:glutathione S-transferase family protein [Sphingomonas montanisoli]TZG27677.1 glutathione S-transferase family protein [Sphingomonas montanisoli]